MKKALLRTADSERLVNNLPVSHVRPVRTCASEYQVAWPGMRLLKHEAASLTSAAAALVTLVTLSEFSDRVLGVTRVSPHPRRHALSHSTAASVHTGDMNRNVHRNASSDMVGRHDCGVHSGVTDVSAALARGSSAFSKDPTRIVSSSIAKGANCGSDWIRPGEGPHAHV